jgi:hypothetical protein
MQPPLEAKSLCSCGKTGSVYAFTFTPVNACDIDEGHGRDMDASDSFVGGWLTTKGKVVTLRDANFSTHKASSLNVRLQFESRRKTGNRSLI